VLDQVHLFASLVGRLAVDDRAAPGDVLADRLPLGGVEAEVVAGVGQEREDRLVSDQLGAEGVEDADRALARGLEQGGDLVAVLLIVASSTRQCQKSASA
jgi:hypothetical protein